MNMDDITKILEDGNYTLIDVREEMELDMDGYLEDAWNIPLGELEDHTDAVLEKQGPIIFFCRSGGRSQKATDYFRAQGREDVYNGGGFKDMQAALKAE